MLTDEAAGLGEVAVLEAVEEARLARAGIGHVVELAAGIGLVAVSGEVVDANQAVIDAPDTVNSDPYGSGWLLKVRFSALPELLDHTAYRALIGE